MSDQKVDNVRESVVADATNKVESLTTQSDSNVSESAWRALRIALLVAVVCSLFVSLAVVMLRPHYNHNLEADRAAQLNDVLGILAGVDNTVSMRSIQTRMVDLASGTFDDSINALTFDARDAATDPQQSVDVAPAHDIAGLGRRPTHAKVFIARSEAGEVRFVILPVWGGGYQSTLYAYLALSGDASTVLALDFYEHGETPGIGARIDEHDWRNQWSGKNVFDDAGVIRLGVAKGQIKSGSVEARYMVDGLSGATRTSNSVTQLLHYWLSDQGYGPFLQRLRRGEV